jgi:glycosyltransferase involved in cell wall biosynthesis
VAALATALQRLIGDPGLRADLGAAAHATVAERFSAAQTAQAYEALYDAALGPRRA